MDERDRGHLSSADDNLAEVSTSLEMTKGGADLVEGELAINDRTNPPRFDCAQQRQQVRARTDADATNADQSAENVRDVEHIDLVVAELLQHAGHVVAHVDQADLTISQRRTTVALQIDADHLPALRELGQVGTEHFDLAQAAM